VSTPRRAHGIKRTVDPQRSSTGPKRKRSTIDEVSWRRAPGLTRCALQSAASSGRLSAPAESGPRRLLNRSTGATQAGLCGSHAIRIVRENAEVRQDARKARRAPARFRDPDRRCAPKSLPVRPTESVRRLPDFACTCSPRVRHPPRRKGLWRLPLPASADASSCIMSSWELRRYVSYPAGRVLRTSIGIPYRSPGIRSRRKRGRWSREQRRHERQR
jgi:hypothetical protein